MSYRARFDALRNGTLEPAGFGHRDHIGVACEALAAFDFCEAHLIVANGIRDLTRRAGAPDKFNATVTFAYMSLIAERMQTGAFTCPADFVAQNRDLGQGALLEGLYSRERMTSPLARAVPLLPDLPHPAGRTGRGARGG